MLETFLRDARFATRLLVKSPLFTVTAALSLAVGMGAGTTIGPVCGMRATMYRRLPP